MSDLLTTVVLIPARNEQLTIGNIVALVKGHTELDVVVIDDASTDNTFDAATRAGAVVLPLTIHLGSWAAIQTGMMYALEKGYQKVITMDADGQHIAEVIPTLLAASTQADVVIGSCPERVSELKGAAWYFFRKLTGLKIMDLTSGFRIYSVEAVKLLVSDELLFLGYQDIGVLLLIQSQGLHIMEVDVMMNDRIIGSSRVYYSWIAILTYFLQTTILCVSKKTKKYEVILKGYADD
jgi:glycosyltransferase involved in cell wall biosynthesis